MSRISDTELDALIVKLLQRNVRGDEYVRYRHLLSEAFDKHFPALEMPSGTLCGYKIGDWQAQIVFDIAAKHEYVDSILTVRVEKTIGRDGAAQAIDMNELFKEAVNDATVALLVRMTKKLSNNGDH